MDMTHINAMDALEREAAQGRKKGERSATGAAALVGVAPAVWGNWRARGPSAEGRLRLWLASRKDGRRLLRQWLALQPKAAA